MRAAPGRFLAQRLTLARELRGLTKTELAHRIGKSAGAISHFERGRAHPDMGTLGALSLCLCVPLEFFGRSLRTQRLGLEECHFRSLRSASQMERRQLLAFGTLLCEFAQELEQDVELPTSDIEPRQHLDDESLEERALEVRQRWGLGLGPIHEPIRLLERHGIIVALVPKACARVDAFSGWQGERPFVFLLSDSEPSRLRFDAAHELGHLVMHTDVLPGHRSMERQADRFGASFLVPKETFLAHWHGKRARLEAFYELKRHWGVSAALLIRRAYDLGCISQSSYQRLFQKLSVGGRSKEPYEMKLEMPSLLEQAVKLSGRKVSELADALALRVQDVPALLKGQPQTTEPEVRFVSES